MAGFSSLLSLFLPKDGRETVTVMPHFSQRMEERLSPLCPYSPKGWRRDCHRYAHSSQRMEERLAPLCTFLPTMGGETVTVVHILLLTHGRRDCHRCAHTTHPREERLSPLCTHHTPRGVPKVRNLPYMPPRESLRWVIASLYTSLVYPGGIYHPVYTRL